MPFKDIEKRRESVREWNRQNPDVVAQAVARYREKNRIKVFNAYGGKCAKCGTTQRLELHHKLHDGNEHRKQIGSTVHIFRWAIKNNYPKDRLELLCGDCHREQHPRKRNNLGQYV